MTGREQYKRRLSLSESIAREARIELEDFIFDGIRRILESGYRGDAQLCYTYGNAQDHYLLKEGRLIKLRVGGSASGEEEEIPPERIRFEDEDRHLDAARTIEDILMSTKFVGNQARFDIDGSNGFYIVEPKPSS